MALYLGSGGKVKLNFAGLAHSLTLFSGNLILNGVMLLSYNGSILKDSNGLYLTVKESE